MIDCHLHVGQGDRTAEETLDHCRGIGADAAWILALEAREKPNNLYFPTDDVMALYEQAPGMVLPFCSVDPRDGDALKRIEAYATAGCRGFGDHAPAVAIDDEQSKQVYKLCGELHLPVVLRMIEYQCNYNCLNLPEVLAEFPQTIFVAHGPSFWSYIEMAPDPPDGYPEGPIRETGPALEWLEQFPNLYASLAGQAGLNALTRDAAFAREVLLGKFSARLLFGTECPCFDGHGAGFWKGCYGEKLLAALADVAPSEEILRAVLHSNAAGLVPLKGG
jgi:predicted TIM-barrel fold metal-dependent hydrolase